MQNIPFHEIEHLNKSQKAMIIAKSMSDIKEQKKKWLANARVEFSPGEKKPCVICGKYTSVTHAHHLVPLSWQFDNGYESPNHDFSWVCPTHHSAIHIYINNLLKNISLTPIGFPPSELDEMQKIIGVFVKNYMEALK